MSTTICGRCKTEFDGLFTFLPAHDGCPTKRKVFRITVETKYVTRTLTTLAVTAEDALDENQSWLIHIGGKVVNVEQIA